MDKPLICKPIGYFRNHQSEKYMAPRQAEMGIEHSQGVIVLNSGFNFEQALEDLEGFERIWVLYWFDRNETWKPKVITPRPGPKRGVFATRAPHRPNPIGFSCVKLLRVSGKKVFIGKNDLLNGTPILDIKPYLTYADAFPESKQGWIENAPVNSYPINWSSHALQQAAFIEENQKIPLIDTVVMRLQNNPYPFKNHRIKKIKENTYELAFKTWRLHYQVENQTVIINHIESGYDKETLEGNKSSRWNDVSLHKKFSLLFPIIFLD